MVWDSAEMLPDMRHMRQILQFGYSPVIHNHPNLNSRACLKSEVCLEVNPSWYRRDGKGMGFSNLDLGRTNLV